MADKLDITELEKLRDTLPIPKIYYYEETSSTNEQGLRLAMEGAGEFTLLIAERQTAGRGRLGRKWITGEGTSLAISVILRPGDEEISFLSLFSLMGALAVCRAIRSTCPHAAPKVKWPNDVLLEDKKTTGILAESNWQGERLAGLVLGIGINIFAGSVPPANELLFPATCVQAHCSGRINRTDFLTEVLREIIALRPVIGQAAFLQEYSQHLAFAGQTVFLKSGSGKVVQGKLAGVEKDGRVILRDEDGKERSYPIGDMHLRPGES